MSELGEKFKKIKAQQEIQQRAESVKSQDIFHQQAHSVTGRPISRQETSFIEEQEFRKQSTLATVYPDRKTQAQNQEAKFMEELKTQLKETQNEVKKLQADMQVRDIIQPSKKPTTSKFKQQKEKDESQQQQMDKMKIELEKKTNAMQRLKSEMDVLKSIQPKKKLITTRTKSPDKTQERQLIDRLKIQLKNTEQEVQRLHLEQSQIKTGTIHGKGLCGCIQQKSVQLNQLEQRYEKLEESNQSYKLQCENMKKHYEQTQQALQEEQDKNYKNQEEIRRLQHYKSQVTDLQDKIEELELEKKKLSSHIRDLCSKPFFRDANESVSQTGKIKEYETNMTEQNKLNRDLHKKIEVLEAEMSPLREKIQLMSNALQQERSDKLLLQNQLEEKSRKWSSYEEQLKLFSKGREEDYDQFMQALGALQLNKEPNWAKIDFLTKSHIPEDIPQLKREIERLHLEKVQIAAELDKVQTLLNIKHDMEKETKGMYEKEIDSLRLQVKAANTRAEDMARLADFRANRVIQLEKNMRLNIFDDQMKVIASKDQIHIQDFETPEFQDAPLTEIGVSENVVDLFLSNAQYHEQSLTIHVGEQLGKNVASFGTIDFYNHETQSTPITEGLTPNFNTLISFKMQVDDFFIQYLEKEFIKLEVHLCRAQNYFTFGIAKIRLNELLKRSGPLAEQSFKTPIVEGIATIVNNIDNDSSMGQVHYKIRMRRPISEALRLYKDKKDIVEYAGLQVLETFKGQAKEDYPKRTLSVTIIKVVNLRSHTTKNLLPFVFFQFYTFEEKISKTGSGQDALFGENFIFEVTIDPAFKKYLESQCLEFTVFDDNAPLEDKKLSDLIGTSRVPLNNLIIDQNVEGYSDLISTNGIHVGQIQFVIGWTDSATLDTGYGTPLTRVWEIEIYKKIGEVLKSKGLTIESAFNVFDQDGDDLISPQEFRNTLLITLRMQISEQDIQLLLNAANLINGAMSKLEFNRKFEGILDKAEDVMKYQKRSSKDKKYDEIPAKAAQSALSMIFNRIKSTTKGDIGKLWQAFESFDKSHTYQISPDNFRYIMKSLQIHLTETELNQLMFNYDPNHQGHFNYVEFLKNLQDSLANTEEIKIMKQIGKILKDENISLYEAFKKFDTNGDGKISMNEFFQAFNQMKLISLSSNQIQRLWHATERDKDDCINYPEFCEKFQAYGGVTESTRDVAIKRPEEARVKLARLIRENGVDLHTAFSHFDRNGDGRISREEFTNALQNLNIAITYYDIQELMKQADRDNNNYIDYKEFSNLIQARRSQDILKKILEAIKLKNLSIEDAFLLFDERGDGYISRTEFYQVFPSLGLSITPQEVDDCMQKMTKNNRISYQEFSNALLSVEQMPEEKSVIHKFDSSRQGEEDDILQQFAKGFKDANISLKSAFDMFDTDRSGTITLDELKKMFNQLNLGQTSYQIKKVLDRMDIEKTGFVSYREFVNTFASYGVMVEAADLKPEYLRSPTQGSLDHSMSVSQRKNLNDPDYVQLQDALTKVNTQLVKQGLKVHDLFAIYDTNSDGKLTINEFRSFLDSLFVGMTQTQFSLLIKHVDKNIDGTISIKEFEDMLKESQQYEQIIGAQKRTRSPAEIATYFSEYMKKNKKDMTWLFRKFDKDQNSQISKLELQKGLHSIGIPLTAKEFDSIWQEMTSGDKVNFVQMKNFVAKYQFQTGQEKQDSRDKVLEATESLRETVKSTQSAYGTHSTYGTKK